ncbi:MAG: hypothetical protein CM1200mP22_07260 [Dehalococcoidia bacterium]|nr:MAG: hypothetical protein CM1200mP22_07260 [Dehalococcoidia bacterium]
MPVEEIAFITALAIAGGEGTVETEPIPLAPNGLVGEMVSTVSSIRSGICMPEESLI